jgi:hypothetical protein
MDESACLSFEPTGDNSVISTTDICLLNDIYGLIFIYKCILGLNPADIFNETR